MSVVCVFTGNSNTGGATLEALTERFADKFKTIRAVVRRDATMAELEEFPGVQGIKGDITKHQILGPVLGDVDVCYFATPGTQNRAELGKKFVDACIEHGVEYGIIISMVGADQKATEYQRQFAEIEEYAMSKQTTSVKLQVGDKGQVKFKPIILRSALFYQNMYGSVAGIQAGTLYYPLGDGHGGKLGHVDLQDVGKCVASVMADPAPHAGKTYNLVGEYHAGNSLANSIGMKAQVGCKYYDVDDDTAIAAFEALGLQLWIAKGNVEMLKWFRDGNGQDIKSDIQELTGEKPARFGDFVKDCLKPLLAA